MKPREFWVALGCENGKYVDEVKPEMFYHSDGLVHHVIEKSAYDRAIETLKKVTTENLKGLDYNQCTHNFEPDTSMTIMKCEHCGVGSRTSDAFELLKELGEIE